MREVRSVILICLEKKRAEKKEVVALHRAVHSQNLDFPKACWCPPPSPAPVPFPVTQTATDIGPQEVFGEHCRDRSLCGERRMQVEGWAEGSQQVTGTKASADPRAGQNAMALGSSAGCGGRRGGGVYVAL